MGTHTGNVLTLANSIIGVSVLAMPFCFKQCGILLSILMLLFSNIITRLACHYLMKSAIMEKRKNFEMLAFRVFGPTGKLIVELCIIGFMLGTCVAYFVIMGDLGPGIIGPIFGFQHPTALRPSVLIGIAVFVVLPLGLLKNVDSLSAVCAATIAFYFCLVLKVMGEALNHLVGLDWMDKVYYWRPSGILQCIPIFSMALSCQTQLFEIFDSLPSTPLERMNAVVKSALNMVTLFYISVGFFGYIAYCDQTFSGNLMMNFSPTITSDVIKIGFLLSVAVSFPLVIFPCRASIYSLCFSKGYEHTQTGSAHIPESRFQCITLVIVTASLVAGLLIPNIEVVLGLVGSTIGVIICVIIPAIIFISLTMRNNNEKLVAKFLVGTGLVIMVLGTYANLYATEEAVSGPEINRMVPKDKAPPMPNILGKVKIKDETLEHLKGVEELAALPELKPMKDTDKINDKPLVVKSDNKENLNKLKEPEKEINRQVETVIINDAKKEPPVPEEPQEMKAIKKEPALPEPPQEIKVLRTEAPLVPKKVVLDQDLMKNVEGKQDVKEEAPVHEEPPVIKAPERVPVPQQADSLVQNKDLKKEGQEVIRKEQPPQDQGKLVKLDPLVIKDLGENLRKNEVKALEENNMKKVENDEIKENLIEKIKVHEEAQKKLNEEGVKLLKALKDVVKNDNNSLKLINVKTGMISDIKSSSLPKNNVVPEEQQNERLILTQKIVQGIPLPLAMKDTVPSNVKAKETNNKQENEVIDKLDNVNRDKLGETKELREKRDVDEVLKAESSGPVPSEGIILASESTPVASFAKSNQSQPDSVKAEPNKIDNDETGHKETLSKSASENCNKNEESSHSQKVDSIVNNEKVVDELIKSPSYLSNPKSVLNDPPQFLNGDVVKGNIPQIPKKRDLKSLSIEDLEEKQRNS